MNKKPHCGCWVYSLRLHSPHGQWKFRRVFLRTGGKKKAFNFKTPCAHKILDNLFSNINICKTLRNCPNSIIDTRIVTLAPGKFRKAVKLLACIQKVRGSYLTRGTEYAG